MNRVFVVESPRLSYISSPAFLAVAPPPVLAVGYDRVIGSALVGPGLEKHGTERAMEHSPRQQVPHVTGGSFSVEMAI